MKLRADLRPLIAGQDTTSLSLETAAGATSIPVDSPANFSAGMFILIGSLGSETAEIQRINTITGFNLDLTAALEFSQPQDTGITVLPYDQINFYHSATVSGTLTPLNLSPQTIVPDNLYNNYDDLTNTTGYGWYQFYNSSSSTSSELSNPVPYAGFADNSVKAFLDRFYTQITNREHKLIRDEDVISWLNEAYATARNRLNLVNRAYNVPTPFVINIVAGTAEYALPDQFSKIRTVNKQDGGVITFISIDDMPNYVNSFPTSSGTLDVKYYLRGNYIGFAPTPSASATYQVYYQTSSPILSSYIDYVDLPQNNYYFLLDFLLFRARPIIGGNQANDLQAFNNGLNALVVTSHKQDGDASKFDQDMHTVV